MELSEDIERLRLGLRVREERQRLGFCQEIFAALGGVSRTSQRNYESGVREPSVSYLRLIAKHGADAQYLLTGVRSNAELVRLFSKLSLRGAEFAREFDRLGEKEKAFIEQALQMAAHAPRPAAN